jgi:hypothetical protein
MAAKATNPAATIVATGTNRLFILVITVQPPHMDRRPEGTCMIICIICVTGAATAIDEGRR